MHGADLGGSGRSFERVQADPGSGALPALGAGEHEMHRSRDHVGQLMQLQRALVGDDRTGFPQRQPRRDHVFVAAGREVPQPVQTLAGPLVPPTRSGMMTKGAAIHTSRQRLPRTEVTGLRLS